MKVYYIELQALSSADILLLIDELPRERRMRAERAKHDSARRAIALSYHLLRYAAAKLNPPLLVSHDFMLSPLGKPKIAESEAFHFSISHTEYAAAVAVSANKELGLDLEAVRPLRSALVSRFASSEEILMINNENSADAISLWTKKEAVVKKSGVGIGQDLRQVHVSDTETISCTIGGAPHMLSLSPADSIELTEVSRDMLFSSLLKSI